MIIHKIDNRVSLAVARLQWVFLARVCAAAVEIWQAAVTASVGLHFTNNRKKRTINCLVVGLLAHVAPRQIEISTRGPVRTLYCDTS